MEIWKEIKETNNQYSISNYGNIRNNNTMHVLKASINRKGYVDIQLYFQGNKKKFRIHRLVAEYFIPKIENKPQVNHIDGNKLNNRVDNLEWCNNYENAHHAIEHGLWENVFLASRRTNEGRKKKIIATHRETGKTILFESIAEAERYFNNRHICSILKGERKSTHGYTFKYAGDGDAT